MFSRKKIQKNIIKKTNYASYLRCPFYYETTFVMVARSISIAFAGVNFWRYQMTVLAGHAIRIRWLFQLGAEEPACHLPSSYAQWTVFRILRSIISTQTVRQNGIMMDRKFDASLVLK